MQVIGEAKQKGNQFSNVLTSDRAQEVANSLMSGGVNFFNKVVTGASQIIMNYNR